jgi:hypothetical protein
MLTPLPLAPPKTQILDFPPLFPLSLITYLFLIPGKSSNKSMGATETLPRRIAVSQLEKHAEVTESFSSAPELEGQWSALGN